MYPLRCSDRCLFVLRLKEFCTCTNVHVPVLSRFVFLLLLSYVPQRTGYWRKRNGNRILSQRSGRGRISLTSLIHKSWRYGTFISILEVNKYCVPTGTDKLNLAIRFIVSRQLAKSRLRGASRASCISFCRHVINVKTNNVWAGFPQ